MAGLSTNAPGLWGGFAGLLYGSTSLSTPPGFLADATPAWVLPGAALDLDFADGLGYNSRNLATTTPDSILTYTAPSPKLVYGDDGVLRYAPHNLLTYSEQFENAAWVKSDVTVSADAIAAPNGTVTADQIVESATTAVHRALTAIFTLSAVPYTFSIRVKKNLTRRLYVNADTLMGVRSLFDLSAGTVVSTLAGSATIADIGNDYWLITVTGTGTGASNRVYLQINRTSSVSAADDNYAGDGASGIYVWGAQLNLGSSALTYIPTTTAARYSLPIDHNPTTFEPLGVLIEEQRTNLCLYSDDFTNAAWVKTNVTAAKTAAGPDGVANSASTLTATAANATARQDVTSASAARITSMFVKRRTGTGAVYLSQGGTTGSELWTDPTPSILNSGGSVGVYVDATNTMSNTGAAVANYPRFLFRPAGMQVGKLYKVEGTLTGNITKVTRVRLADVGADSDLTYNAGTGVISGIARAGVAGIQILTSIDGAETVTIATMSVYEVAETTVTVTSDWTRVATASATITNPPLIIRMATSGDAIDVDLFQHELGAFITSPVPTVASQVTRAADQVSILTSAFAYNAAAGTVAVEAQVPSDVDGALGNYFFSISDGTTSNLIHIAEINGVRSQIVSGAAVQFDSTVGAEPTTGVLVKAAVGYAANDMRLARGGSLGTADTSGTVPSGLTILRVGVRGDANFITYLNGHIKRLTHFPTRRSNADLQVLST